MSSFIPSVNLHRLDLSYVYGDFSSEITVQSEMMPKIREFHTSESLRLTKLLCAKKQDERPAFNFMNLRRLSISLIHGEDLEDKQDIRYLLRNARILENLHLSVVFGRTLVELHGVLSPSARTLKVLDLSVLLEGDGLNPLPLAGLCKELEAIAGHNMLEALSFEVRVKYHETEDFIGSMIQEVEKVLVKPGWSALRQVSFKVSIACCPPFSGETLQSLPDKYLSHLSKLESVAFNYSAYGRCTLNWDWIYDLYFHFLFPATCPV